MTDDPDQTDLSSLMCFGAYALTRAFGRFYQAAFAETGLTYPKFVILMALDEAGPLTVSALSARASVEPNTLSPLLKKMASFGLITRQRSEEDERRVVLTLTETGRGVMQRAHDVALRGFDGLGLDPQEVARTVRFLRDVRARVDAADPPRLRLDDVT